MLGTVALEERSVGEKLGEYTAHAPHIHWLPITRILTEDLGRAVPSSDHILSEHVLRTCIEPSRETEVTDGEVTVRIDQKIGRLQISVEDIRRMDLLQRASLQCKRRASKTIIMIQRATMPYIIESPKKPSNSVS